jgi:hypothetical protein
LWIARKQTLKTFVPITSKNLASHTLLVPLQLQKELEMRLSVSPATPFSDASLPNHTKMFELVHLVTSVDDFGPTLQHVAVSQCVSIQVKAKIWPTRRHINHKQDETSETTNLKVFCKLLPFSSSSFNLPCNSKPIFLTVFYSKLGYLKNNLPLFWLYLRLRRFYWMLPLSFVAFIIYIVLL